MRILHVVSILISLTVSWKVSVNSGAISFGGSETDMSM